jgi:spore coat polysaccharide biosynthesis protein SpsF (cytidylyltransferase family)
LDHKKITGTSVELITNNVIGPNEMFPKLLNEQERYAVMFLKNEKYFVVMVDSNGFYLRDCHIDTQRNFKTLDTMFEHLSNFYQFTKMISIDGFQLEDYSSIEFLIFDQQFDSDNLMKLLE